MYTTWVQSNFGNAHETQCHSHYNQNYYTIHDFLNKKTIFLPQARFSYIMLEIRLRFSEHIFNFYLFIFFVYLVRFKTNNKRFFLTCMLTRVSNLTTYISFIIVLVLRCSSDSMFLSFNLTTSTMGEEGEGIFQ